MRVTYSSNDWPLPSDLVHFNHEFFYFYGDHRLQIHGTTCCGYFRRPIRGVQWMCITGFPIIRYISIHITLCYMSHLSWAGTLQLHVPLHFLSLCITYCHLKSLTTMGTQMATSYGNLFVRKLECEFLSSHDVELWVWWKFIDNILSFGCMVSNYCIVL